MKRLNAVRKGQIWLSFDIPDDAFKTFVLRPGSDVGMGELVPIEIPDIKKDDMFLIGAEKNENGTLSAKCLRATQDIYPYDKDIWEVEVE
jgi:hypothetical protein